MNILFLAHTSLREGSSIALANLVKGLTALGHQVYVITNNDKGPLSGMVESAGGSMFYGPVSLTVFPRTGRFLGKIMRLFRNLCRWRKAKRLVGRIIDQYHIDLVHSNVGPMNLALSECQKRGIPHVWHLREYQDLDIGIVFFPYKGKFRKLIHQQGNYNIAITEGVFNHFSLRPDVDKVIYDGVFSEAKTKESYVQEKEDYFLFVGRVQEAKCPHFMLKPFAEFLKKYPTYRLIIAGPYLATDKYYRALKKTITASHIEKSVVFLGNRNDVYELMQKAKALIVPSRFEGFGFITAEAMMNNCLVIGRDTAGTKEQFDIGLRMTGQEIGIRFNDEKELLQGLFTAVETDTSLMLQFAREVVVSKYTLEKSAAETDVFYRQCMANHYKA
ncbi:MAG: glycosyltransferase family 4 protein [Bacteroidaceae bacterium]|nr:glycosyltransferase family 4 protein [Bacteroidaceae bacterium]